MLNDEQSALIDRVSREEGFEHFSVSVENISKKGENYLGYIFLVKVKEKDDKKETSYILKCAETNAIVRTQLPIDAAYQREIFLYETVLPMFESFQRKYHFKHPFRAFGKILGYSTADNNEFLLMENIKCRGFRMLDRKQPMDDAHVALVFRELAKFHSISLAMKQLEPETYKRLSENLDNPFERHERLKRNFEEKFSQKFDTALKVIEGHQKATEALKKRREGHKRDLDEYRNEKNHLLIVHGDLWCNNLMFKYEDTTNLTKPTTACFLDWQISRIQSPAWELYYFLFHSTSKVVLDNHRNHFDLYYLIVDENLQSAGCDTKSVFPYDLFREHLKKLSTIGLITAVGNMDTVLKDEQDAQNFVDMVESGLDLLEQFWKEGDLSDEFCQRVRDLVFTVTDSDYF